LDVEAEEIDALNSTNRTQKRPAVVEETETVVLERKDPHPLWALLSGLPSPMNTRFSAATFAINALLVLAAWDLTFRSTMFYPARDLSFARVGYVGPHSAKLLVREPNKEHWPVSVWYQPDTAEAGIANTHLVDSIPYTNNETDFTKVININKLSPETKYRYFTSSNHSGTFSTAPSPGHPPKNGKFTFLTSSCIKQRFPYSPFQHPLSIPGLRVMKDIAADLKASFMLFLGDFIYIDVPRRPGTDVESYRQQYRQIYASKDWTNAANELPFLHVADDHEIANDWDAGTSGVYHAAMEPFNTYHHAVNPPPVRKTGEKYYTFEWGSSASFFMLDTRTYRSKASMEDGPDKTMLGKQQLEDLLNWLKKATPGKSHGEEVQWKFIISSVPFTKNWHFGGNDTWGGYLHERQQILEAAWSISGRSGVVVLSGDRHEFAATEFPPPEGSKAKAAGRASVYEFSCSPLSQFYLPVRTYRQTDADDVAIK
jgi:alkaline phosphatase D